MINAVRRTMRRHVVAVLPLLLLGSSGCFRYTYVPIADAPAGKEVRVHLTPEGHTRLTAMVGDQLPNLGRIFDGALVQRDAQQLLVSVRLATDARVASAGLLQRVAVPLQDIQTLELKQLDRRKMMAVGVGAGVLLAAVIAHYVGGVFGGTTSPFPEPGQPELRLIR